MKKLSEVTVKREYRFTTKTPDQSKKLADNISEALNKSISPLACEVQVVPSEKDPSLIVVHMKCVDGTAVHNADLRSMSRVIQLCEQNGMAHEIGDLQVIIEH